MIKQKSYYLKLFLAVMTVSFVVMLSFAMMMYLSTSETVKKEIQNKCVSLAVSSAEFLAHKPDELLDFKQSLETDSDYYREIKTVFENIKSRNKEHIAFLYAEAIMPDGELVYLFDGEPEGTDFFSEAGRREDMLDEHHAVYRTKEVTVTDFYPTVWGTHMFAFAPVCDYRTEEVIALVGVDVSIEQYNALMSYPRRAIFGSALILISAIAVVLIATSDKIEKLLFIDSATGIYDKRFFKDELRIQINTAFKENLSLSLFLMAPDNYRDLVAANGSLFGNAVMKDIAETVTAILRTTDYLARYGNDTFAVCLPCADKNRAHIIAERIKSSVAALKHTDANGEPVSLTISIGIAQYFKGQSAVSLLENADKALIEAQNSENTTEIF